MPRARETPLTAFDGGFPFLRLSRGAGAKPPHARGVLEKLRRMKFSRLSIAAFTFVMSCAAHAVDLVPRGAFIEGGISPAAGYSVTAGVTWPWAWRQRFGNLETTGLTEAYISHWSSRDPVRESFTQVGLLPLVRLRPDQGRSAWFLEGGIGISVMDSIYHMRDKHFSTRFNFVDVIGVGRSFGADRRRELSLRFSHISNANIKKPNPGENFLQLRYAVAF
jgi:lipid A 3-O-deacylase